MKHFHFSFCLQRLPKNIISFFTAVFSCLILFVCGIVRGIQSAFHTLFSSRLFPKIPPFFSRVNQKLSPLFSRVNQKLSPFFTRIHQKLSPFFTRIDSRLSRISWKKTFRCFLRIFLISSAFAAAAAAVFVWILILKAPRITASSVTPKETCSYILNQNGSVMQKLSLSSANREILPFSEIPASLKQAMIVIEDRRFYEHPGIDIRGIGRAFLRGIKNGSFSEGASTITQQLLKNAVFTDWTQESGFFDRLCRKIQEQYLALKLEQLLSKDEILCSYLNTINFGSGCYGAQAASRYYFGKDASDLSLSEAAVLAAIPQNPSRLNPVVHPEKNSRRRLTILNYLEEEGYITSEENQAAQSDAVYQRISSFHSAYSAPSVYSYYEDALIEDVIQSLMDEKGYSYEDAHQLLYSGGLRILSAQNSEIQSVCEKACSNPASFPSQTSYQIEYSLRVSDSNGMVSVYDSADFQQYVLKNYDSTFSLLCTDTSSVQTYADRFRRSLLEQDKLCVLEEQLSLIPQPQVSVVVLDQHTGYVQAIVGGRGKKTGSLTLNRATKSLRQPGSTFKILTAYAPALDCCHQTLATCYENQPCTYPDGTAVSNWDLNDYSGPVTIREAIIRSINVAAVRCIHQITPALGFSYAVSFGITTLQTAAQTDKLSSDQIEPLALGGISRGVTNLELCASYAAIADGGLYRKPTFFLLVTDSDGTILLDHRRQSSLSVLKASTAFLLTDAMRDVIRSEEGTAYGLVSLPDMAAAGKTGTTSSYKDIWFVGYTPYYTCCVWGGYDSGKNLPDLPGAHTYSKTLWNTIMNQIHETLSPKEFSQPDSVLSVSLCRKSHKKAIPGVCPDCYSEFFEKGTEPSEFCLEHTLPASTLDSSSLNQSSVRSASPASRQTEADLDQTESSSPFSGSALQQFLKEGNFSDFSAKPSFSFRP